MPAASPQDPPSRLDLGLLGQPSAGGPEPPPAWPGALRATDDRPHHPNAPQGTATENCPSPRNPIIRPGLDGNYAHALGSCDSGVRAPARATTAARVDRGDDAWCVLRPAPRELWIRATPRLHIPHGGERVAVLSVWSVCPDAAPPRCPPAYTGDPSLPPPSLCSSPETWQALRFRPRRRS